MMQTIQKRRLAGFLLVISGASLWGIGGTVSQYIFETYRLPVEWLVAVRLLLSGILLLTISLMLGNKEKVTGVWKQKKSAGAVLIFGLFGMLAVQYTYMASIESGNAAVATLLQYLAPVFILAYLLAVRHTYWNIRDTGAVLMGLAGTFLLLTNGELSGLSVPTEAVVWGLLSGAALAFYTLYAGPLLAAWGSMNVIGWAMTVGGAAVSFLHAPWDIAWESWTWSVAGSVIFVVIFGTMIAFWFYLESLKYLKPQETSILGCLEPLSAILASVWWLHVPFGLYQSVGACLILAMVVYLSLPQKQQAKKPAPA
ncbi:DMT family transporter [Marinococcus halotolerans]|uniref:DMT family transporter n=1 Tax=Marinococcus halotolerans TaxID=301092 RepID=UPI00048487C8|nr:DMT family transporter [Marinococcus halotolerans]